MPACLRNERPIEIRALSGMEQRNIYTRVAGRVCDTAKKVHNFVQQRIVHGRRFHEQQKYAVQLHRDNNIVRPWYGGGEAFVFANLYRFCSKLVEHH